MQKTVDFFENRKEFLFGMLAALAAGIIGYRFYKEVKSERANVIQEEEKEMGRREELLSPTADDKKRLIPKEGLLIIVAAIKKECDEDLRLMRNTFRNKRRNVFENEDAYQRAIDEYNEKSQFVIKNINDKILNIYNVSGQNFDESVQALRNDEEVTLAVSSMTRPEEDDLQAPDRVTKDLLLEILTFNNKRYNEAAFAIPRRGYDYLLTRIQDEIYFKYKIEVEELNACYKKFNCDDDPYFTSKVQEMKLSTSKLFYG